MIFSNLLQPEKIVASVGHAARCPVCTLASVMNHKGVNSLKAILFIFSLLIMCTGKLCAQTNLEDKVFFNYERDARKIMESELGSDISSSLVFSETHVSEVRLSSGSRVKMRKTTFINPDSEKVIRHNLAEFKGSSSELKKMKLRARVQQLRLQPEQRTPTIFTTYEYQAYIVNLSSETIVSTINLSKDFSLNHNKSKHSDEANAAPGV